MPLTVLDKEAVAVFYERVSSNGFLSRERPMMGLHGFRKGITISLLSRDSGLELPMPFSETRREDSLLKIGKGLWKANQRERVVGDLKSNEDFSCIRLTQLL